MVTWSLRMVKSEQGVVDTVTCQPTSSFRAEGLVPITAGRVAGTQLLADNPLWEYPG